MTKITSLPTGFGMIGKVSSPSTKLCIGATGTGSGAGAVDSGRTGAAAGNLCNAALSSTASGGVDKIPAGTGAGAAVRRRSITGTLSTDSVSVTLTEPGLVTTILEAVRCTVLLGLVGVSLHLMGLWRLGRAGLSDLVGLADRITALVGCGDG